MRKSERGANLLEMAIVTPLLVLMLAGVVDFGRAFQTYNVMTNAAREGARMGARRSCYATNATQRAEYLNRIIWATVDAAAGNGFTIAPGDVTVTPDPLAGCQLAGLPVTVNVQFDVNTIVGSVVGANPIQLSTSAAMSKMANPVVN